MDKQIIFQQLKIAKDFYYKGTPIMSDADFDQLENMARGLDPNNEYFKTVGAPVVRGTKIKHQIPMGSLNHMEDLERIINWQNSVGQINFIISDKLDGNSIVVNYDSEGNFESAATRGDGIEGLDITRHLRRMFKREKPPVPFKAIPGQVRLEAIFKKSLFEDHITGYKNPRNYAAGQLNRTVADSDFIEMVDLIAFDASFNFNSKSETLAEISRLGFDVVSYYHVSGLLDQFLSPAHINDAKAKSEWELDGLVVDIDDQITRDKLGYSHLNPNFAFKYKVNENFIETQVNAVHYRPSKDGYLKPRVEFDEVELAGVSISFATGFNAKFIKDNNIGPGAIIRVTRSGDVIPFIDNVIEGTEASLPSEEEYGAYSWTETWVDLVLNKLPDSSIILGIVDFFTSIDAPLLKEGNVTKLFEAGFTSITEIIQATESDLTTTLGENGTKVFIGLRDKLTDIEEYNLLGSLPFIGRGIGKRKMKVLAEAFGDLAKITYDQIITIQGFEDTTASKIANAIPEYIDFISKNKDFISVKKYEKIDGDLNNVAVCFTGVRSNELEKEVGRRGGKVLSSITKEATHLIAKDPNGKSSKLDKARKNGVVILSLEEAMNLWMMKE